MIRTESEIWGLFGFSAGFAAAAAALSGLRKLLEPEAATWRGGLLLIVDVLTVALFGGLSGWLAAAAFPALAENSPQILGAVAAYLGYSGTAGVQRVFKPLMERVTGVRDGNG